MTMDDKHLIEMIYDYMASFCKFKIESYSEMEENLKQLDEIGCDEEDQDDDSLNITEIDDLKRVE